MNILWESWLGAFTDVTLEAIINRYQGKDIDAYRVLMVDSLKEAYRVLRPDHWMVLVFMNSSQKVWNVLSKAIKEAGFSIQHINIFDKQHGTFKQYVSENTAGADLMIHCKKTAAFKEAEKRNGKQDANVLTFVSKEVGRLPIFPFIHVKRDAEIDYRTLYSRYISVAMQEGSTIINFSDFRDAVIAVLKANR